MTPPKSKTGGSSDWLVEGTRPGRRSKAAEQPAGGGAGKPDAGPKEDSEWLPAGGAEPTAVHPEQSPPPAAAAPPDAGGEREQATSPEPSPAEREAIRTAAALQGQVAKLEEELVDSRNQLASTRQELTARAQAAEASASQRLRKAEETIKEQRGERTGLEKRIRELETQLRKETERAASELERSLADREASFEQRLEEREAALRGEWERRESERNEAIDRLQAELADARKAKPTAKTGESPVRSASKPTRRRRSARSNGKLDLNVATFDELRGLGLSVTQSARLIAYRDVRGGYESLDELDEIRDLSEDVRKELLKDVTLGG